MELGKKIALQRKKAGLSQEDLAEKLLVSRQAVSRWETGSAVPETEKIVALSKLFGVSTDYLLLEEQEQPQPAPGSSGVQSVSERRRKMRLGFSIFLFACGLSCFLLSLILSGIYASFTTEWYTDLGPFATGLFTTWHLALFLIGLIITCIGGVLLVREYRRED